MRSSLTAFATAMALSVVGKGNYSGGGAPTGRAAKSPELQKELIASAKAKRERRALKRTPTKFLKGGIDYVGGAV